MDLKDKIIGMALAALIALVGWNLHETWSMKEQVFKLQQGQKVLSKQIKKNTNFVKQKLKNLKRINLRKRRKRRNQMFNSKWFIVLLFFILLGTGLNGCNTVCPDKTTVNIGTTEVDADNNNKNKTQHPRS